jgi:hypothetical protein
MEPSSKK